MSLVNKMLQELDQRNATQPGAQSVPGPAAGQGLRPVRQTAVGSEWFWRVLAVLMALTVGWVVWVAWQLTPRTNVTELALQSAAKPRAQPPAGPAPGPQAPAPAVPSAAAPAPGRPPRIDTLTLARELSTPIAPRPERAAPAPQRGDRETVAALKPPARAAVSAIPEPSTPPAGAQARAALPAKAGAAPGQIDKRDSNTPRERAEAEFHRAVTFVNQGRMAEGMDAFRATLAADPSYETARQTQVSLLLDAKRLDEAAGSLREGLALNPANATFAMLLARIMVDSNDTPGALALLQKHAPQAQNNAEYHAFVAALYQRLGRHGEASDEYQRALRISPYTAQWWVGLGISLEAQRRTAEAADAFRRARGAGSLTPELASYVDQRLKALR